MQPLQNCIGPTIRIGREILCLPYAEFFTVHLISLKQTALSNTLMHFTAFLFNNLFYTILYYTLLN